MSGPIRRERPYFFGGIGATNYSFGDSLLPGAVDPIGGETRFATNWGRGAKLYFSPKVGAKVMLRWTPTYIQERPGWYLVRSVLWLLALAEAQYSNQFETTGGITVRFE